MTIESIQERIFGKRSDEDNLVVTIFRVMREFGYTLDEVKKLSIPTFKMIVRLINKGDKEMEKPTKGMGMRR